MKPEIMKNKVFDVPNGSLQNVNVEEGITCHRIQLLKHGKEKHPGFTDEHGVLGLNGFISKLPGPHYGIKKLILPTKSGEVCQRL